MTVIASYLIQNHPFMISDLLISVKNTSLYHKPKNLPSPIEKFNLKLPEDAKYTITDVLQKTVRICDRFLLSYSGNVDRAKFLIKHFRELTKTEAPTGKMFKAEFDQLLSCGQIGNLSVLVIIEEFGRIYTGGYNFRRFRSRKFESMKTCGSGLDDIIDSFASYRGKETNRQLSPHEEGLSLSLSLSSILLGKEMVTGEPLQKAYGGCYEISYWNGNDFEKLNEILHLHWIFEYKKEKGLSFDLPVKMQKLEYHNSLLYLRDLEIVDNKVEDIVYIVKPTASSLRNSTIKHLKPSFQYNWVVNHIYILLENGKVRYRNQVSYIHEHNYKLMLDEQDTRFEVKFRPEYFEFMEGILKELQSEDA